MRNQNNPVGALYYAAINNNTEDIRELLRLVRNNNEPIKTKECIMIDLLNKSKLSKIQVINQTNKPIIIGFIMYKIDNSSLPKEFKNNESL